MLDIVSHRVTIGRFHHGRLAGQSRQTCLRMSNLPSRPLLFTLLTLAMVASMMSAASVRTSPLDGSSPNCFPIFTQLATTAVYPLLLPNQETEILLPGLLVYPKLHTPSQYPAPRHQLSLSNKAVHALNGNRASRGIKLSHWNLGSASLQNKISEIEVAVSRMKPSVLGISEANLHYTTDLSTVQLPGYTLFTAKTLKNPQLKMSRVVVYLSEGMSGKVMEDLMSEEFSSIWIEMSVPGNSKNFLVSNVYRDHQWLHQGPTKARSLMKL